MLVSVHTFACFVFLSYIFYSYANAFFLFLFPRIVCEMGRAEMSQYTGNVQVCVGGEPCRPEFMAKSSKLYYFVVSVYF